MKPITVTFYVGDRQVDALTDKEREVVAKRMSEAMSLYYTAHPEEYKRLK